MKRRILFVRTLTTGLSASVFSAAGWLMGTKTLTMPTPPPDEVPADCAQGWCFAWTQQASQSKRCTCCGPNYPQYPYGEYKVQCWTVWERYCYCWVDNDGGGSFVATQYLAYNNPGSCTDNCYSQLCGAPEGNC